MPFKQFASCEPPKPKPKQLPESYAGNIFYFTVLLSDKHADLTDKVISYVYKFLLYKSNRDELHYEEADDGEIQIEDCNGVVLIAEFKNWMDLNEKQELISYSEKISDGNRRNWIISLTDDGFNVLTVRKKKEEEQKKEEEMLKQKQKQRHDPNQRGYSVNGEDEDY